MPLTRRTLLLSAAGGASVRLPERGPRSPAFGVASFSYAGHLARQPELRGPLAFLRFCRERGAGGVQTGIPAGTDPEPLRRYLDSTGAWIEGQVRLPRDAADVDRFAADVRAARAAGAGVVRTAMLSSRRYEMFATLDEYRRFKETSTRQVELAVPVVTRERVRLAVENHKDYRADELVALLQRIGSEWVGVTLDTGNNLALLEEPMSTVEALAPLAFSVHLKDMAVDESPEGFLLSEVPFGRGFLDLPRIVTILRKHRPAIHFNVEMATRDPLSIPCLTERYWATMPELPAPVLARMLRLVRERKEGRPLPKVRDVSEGERLRLEDANVRECLDYTGSRL